MCKFSMLQTPRSGGVLNRGKYMRNVFVRRGMTSAHGTASLRVGKPWLAVHWAAGVVCGHMMIECLAINMPVLVYRYHASMGIL